MENSSNCIVESREEFMISPNADSNAKPILRTAHFLNPSLTFNHKGICELPSLSLPSLPPDFDPKNWPLTVNFHGWKNPTKNWKEWVEKMASFHAATWKKAGIFEAIINSTFEIHQNVDLFFGVAERWCPQTNSFIFPWGEATVTLEDMLIAGYSVLGSPVFEPLETEEAKAVEEALIEERLKIIRTTAETSARHPIWLKKFMDNGSEIEHEAFLSLWLSRFVFPTSYNVIRDCVFPIAVHIARGTRIALAPAVLSTIYRDLSLLKQKVVALTTLDSNEKLAVTTFAPFQLVLVWVWERFVKLSQKPKLIKFWEPRFAQWNLRYKIVRYNTKNVRLLLDSSTESFNWRPYTKSLENWDSPKFYREKETWVFSDSDLDDDLLSFIMCLRVSELVGLEPNCIQKYLPHRVARQFGFDQDVPEFVVQSSGSFKDAWSCYIRPVGDVKCFIPSCLFEKDVTTQYLDWWNSLEFHEHSNSVTDVLKDKKKAKAKASLESGHMRADGDSITPKSSKFKKIEEIYNMAVPPVFHPKCARVELGDVLNRTKEDDIHISIAELKADRVNQSKTFSDSSKIKIGEMNNLSVPPGFHPNCDEVEVGDSSDEDNLTIADILKLKQNQDITTNWQRTDQNNSSPVATETCAASVKRMLKNNSDDNLTPSQSPRHSCSVAVNGIPRGLDQVGLVEEAENGEDVDHENVHVELGEYQSHLSSVSGNDQTPKDSEVKEAIMAENVTVKAKQDVESANNCATRILATNEMKNINGHSCEAASMELEYRIQRLEKINAEIKALLYGRYSGTKHARG